MTFPAIHAKRVLAIDPTSHGLGLAVLEGSDALIDWGMKGCRQNKNEHCRDEVLKLIAHYDPDVLVVEDTGARGCLRRARVRRLIESLSTLAKRHHLLVRRIPRRSVQRCFAVTRPATKREVADAIALRFPELAPYLPPAWDRLTKRLHADDSEDERMAIFDAVGFAMTFYGSQGLASLPAPAPKPDA